MNPAALVLLSLGGGYVVYKAAKGEPLFGGAASGGEAPASDGGYGGLYPEVVVDPLTGLVPGAAAATDPYAPDVTGTAGNAISAVDQAYLAIAEKQAALQNELALAADARVAAQAQADLAATEESVRLMREQAANDVNGTTPLSPEEKANIEASTRAFNEQAAAAKRSTKDAVISGVAMGAPYAVIPAAAGLVKLGAKLRKGGSAVANAADDAAKLAAKTPKLGQALPTGARGVAVRANRALAAPAARVATVATGAYTAARNVVDIGQSLRAASSGNVDRARDQASDAAKRGVQFLSLGTTNMNLDKGTFKVAGVHIKPVENMAKGKFNPLRKSFWK